MKEQAQDTDRAWAALDPLFIMGMQRSGTSVLAIAAKDTGQFWGFAEGHLWFELLRPVARLHMPDYMPDLRLDVFALGAGRVDSIERELALAIDRFHRRHFERPAERWVDKSPGQAAVSIAPLLGHAFPRAQFVFAFRNAITTVNSGMRMWPERPDGFRLLCGAWVKTMRTWRQVRPLLGGRYIEIAQERMAADPGATARKLAAFLRISEFGEQMGTLLATRRENSSFPDKKPGDYRIEINWSADERWLFTGLCGEEMSAWGYPLDLDDPSSPERPPAHGPAVSR